MDYRIQQVILLMRANPSKGHTLSKLARAVSISASRLRHLFKEEVGMTPTQFLKDLRMRAARELMQTSSLSIKQVMMNVGVNDESHFLRDFKKTFGMTPLQCRVLYKTAQLENSMKATQTSAH